jgi:hydroxypyruvate reductase
MRADILFISAVDPTMLPKLESGFTVHQLPASGLKDFPADVAERTRIVVTTGGGGADAALIGALPNLGLIAVGTAGYEAVDLEAAAKRGIAVTHTPDVTANDVADLAFGLLIAVARRIAEAERFIRAGHWQAGGMDFGTRVSGKRLGIVGLGAIGRTIAKRAQGFDIDVAYNGPHRKSDVSYAYHAEVVDLARTVDFLIVSCPGGSETEGLIDRSVLMALGPEGILVNVSRGSVVDEVALVGVLSDGGLGGAGLDVFADEPRVPAKFIAMENVILAPHVGSATPETRAAMTDLAIANMHAYLAGRPLLTPVP